jgi:predicted dehydrogenase
VVIATAAPTHAELACRAFAAGRHVYVEKPLALKLTEAETMAAAATAAGRQLMVGHLIRYHAAFIELQDQLASGVIGALRHVSANRLAMGRIRATESVLFDLCPHDLSLILALLGEEPHSVSCLGASHVTPGTPDILSAWLGFSGGRSAQLSTSWMTPYKEHRLTVTGSRGSIVFDDTRPWAEKLTLYHDEITPDGANFAIARAAAVHLPVAESEPLKQEMRAFVACCESNEAPRTGLGDALAVQRVLETMNEQFTEFGAAEKG